MANLPNLANRINDVEVSQNAPLTESFFRRIGSNVNLLLDFLGIPNGSSSASGDLADLINAINIVSGHTIDLLYTTTTTGQNTTSTQAIGSLSSEKFLNQVIYAIFPAGQANLRFYGETSFSSGMGAISRFFITKKKNGTGPLTIPNFQGEVQSGAQGVLGGPGSPPKISKYLPQGSALRNSHVNAYTESLGINNGGTGTTKPQNQAAPTSPVSPALDYRVASNRPWMQVAELDWREGSSWTLQHNHVNVSSALDPPIEQIQYYRGYKLSIESAGLIY